MAASGSQDSSPEECVMSKLLSVDENQLEMELQERLPEVLVEQILSKLPFSSLFRFSCVCKRWRALIVSFRALLFYDAGQLTVRQTDGGEWEPLPLHFLRVGDVNSMELVASAGGLLCFSTGVVGEIVVCNPLTKCFRRLQIPYATTPRSSQQPFMPFLSRHVRNFGGMTNWRVLITGMVMNSSNAGGGFKLIAAGIFRGSRRTTLVYDSLVDSWKKVADVPKCASFFFSRFEEWRGNLYSIMRDTSFVYKLLKFDFEKEAWSLILLPEGEWPRRPLTLMEYNGTLLMLMASEKQPWGFAYFKLQDSETDVTSWLSMNSEPLDNLLSDKSLKGINIIDCLGQGDLLCLVGTEYRCGSAPCHMDYKHILRMWIHNFTTKSEVVTDLQVEFYKYTYQIFELSMQSCN